MIRCDIAEPEYCTCVQCSGHPTYLRTCALAEGTGKLRWDAVRRRWQPDREQADDATHSDTPSEGA